METQSQEKKILNYLLTGNTLTAYAALTKFDCFRLASRIHRLKKTHPEIKSRMVELTNGKRVAQYFIETKSK